MGARDERVEAIHAASRNHQLVQFTLSSLQDDAETFAAPESLGPNLVTRLQALEADALLSATVGLAELAYVLEEKHGAFEVGEVIRQAIGEVQPKIDQALTTLPDAGRSLGLRKDGFAEKPSGSTSQAVSLDGAPKGHVSNAGFDLTAPSKPKR